MDDTQKCETEIKEVLEKYGCALKPAAILTAGSVDMQVLIVKTPESEKEDAK